MKKITSLVLTVVILCSVFGGLGITAQAYTSGDYIYEVLSDGTAQIIDYTGKDEALIIPDVIDGYAVTSIGKKAFYYCKSLRKVTIPAGVTSIGVLAFCDCENLFSILIPDSITNISSYAFEGCSELANVYISDLEAWCNINFSTPDSNPCYPIPFWDGANLYLNYNLITNLTIPDGVTSICKYAFINCQRITNVSIPNSVTSIGNYAFYYCDNLININITDGVTSIGDCAFGNCWGLTSVTIPKSLTSIGRDAFLCSYYDAKGIIRRYSYIESVYITDVEAWFNINFSNCYSNPFWNEATLYLNNKPLSELTVPKTIKSIGKYAFYNCKTIVRVYITDLEAWCNIDFGNCYSNPLGRGNRLYLNNQLLTDLTVPNSISSIGDYVFYNCRRLENVIIPDGVTSIGDGAFYNCLSLKSITIPNSVTSIGDEAFYTCESLTNVNVTNSDASIEKEDFYTCSSLTNITTSNSVTSIGESAFYYCEKLTSITIPNSVTSIGDGAFYNCLSLKSITIPNSVTSIGERAFYECRKLTDVTIPSSVTSIGLEAFDKCYILESVYITDIKAWCNVDFVYEYSSPFRYGATLYLNDELLTDLTIPDGVTSIGNYAFEGCLNLTNVTISDSVTSIGKYAFYRCLGLKSITIPGSVTSIGYAAFGNCNRLENVTISDGVESIGEFSFYKCSSLRELTIPDSVTSIGDKAFYECDNLIIKCYENSIAEKYVKENGLRYKLICKQHTEAVSEAVAPTCTKTGSTWGKYCSVCNEVIMGMEVIPATGHTEVIVDAVAPSCTETGLTQGKYCSECNEVLVAQEVVPATGHREAISKAITPTCTKTGLTEGKFCSICKEVLVAQEIVPTTHHKLTKEILEEATCTEKGKNHYACTNCDYEEIKTVSAKGHDTEIVGKKSATYFAKGYSGDEVCADCGEVVEKGETLPKLKLKTPTATVKGSNKKITVKYNKASDATGFQVKYKIGKKKVTKTYNTKKTLTKTIKNLKKGTYKVQIRAFVKSGSKKAYSSWTKVKTVKVK